MTRSFTFDGAERPARLLLVGGRLSAARISFGAFSETKLQQLITALDERYALIDPSEAKFRDYDALHRSCVGFAKQDRSVALSVARTQQARINEVGTLALKQNLSIKAVLTQLHARGTLAEREGKSAFPCKSFAAHKAI